MPRAGIPEGDSVLAQSFREREIGFGNPFISGAYARAIRIVVVFGERPQSMRSGPASGLDLKRPEKEKKLESLPLVHWISRWTKPCTRFSTRSRRLAPNPGDDSWRALRWHWHRIPRGLSRIALPDDHRC